MVVAQRHKSMEWSDFIYFIGIPAIHLTTIKMTI